MPRRKRCKGITQYGKQCQYHADKEGLCPVHYRMAHGELGRVQPKGPDKVAASTASPSKDLTTWLITEATPEDFKHLVELRKVPAVLPLLKLTA
jgi:hypothetical protein